MDQHHPQHTFFLQLQVIRAYILRTKKKKAAIKNLHLSGVIHWIFEDLKTSVMLHSTLSWDGVGGGGFIITTELLLSSPGLKTTSIVSLQEHDTQIVLLQRNLTGATNRTFCSDGNAPYEYVQYSYHWLLVVTEQLKRS